MADRKLKVVKGCPFEQDYFRELNEIVDALYLEATYTKKWTWEQLAKESGLGNVTVYMLGGRKTRYPRFMTVYKLAKAVGWTLSLEGKKPKIGRKVG